MNNPSGYSMQTREKQFDFDDVAIYFTEEEWDCLKDEQKELYKDVMMENYKMLLSVGYANEKPSIVLRIEQEEQLFVRSHQQREDDLPTNTKQGESISWKCSEIRHIPLGSMCLMNDASAAQNIKKRQSKHKKSSVRISISKTNEKNVHNEQSVEEACKETMQTNQKPSKHFTYKSDSVIEDSVCQTKNYKFFNRKPELEGRQSMHIGKKKFTCSECGICFKTKDRLESHHMVHTGEKTFSCIQCSKCFRTKSALRIHCKNHTAEKSFACTECSKCFKTKYQLERHHMVHTGEKPFSCSECSKCYRRKAELLDHNRTHTGERPFTCTECSKCFKTKSELARHKTSFHTNMDNVACSEGRKGDLERVQKSHPKKKRVSCSECGKYLSCNTELRLHQMIHTGEKPFTCPECGKSFRRNTMLTRHVKIHTGEKLFSCSECGKHFSQKSKLLIHERLHTGEKPFTCSECGKGFRYREQLKSHEMFHTGEKPFSCLACGMTYGLKEELVKHQTRNSKNGSECGKLFSHCRAFSIHKKSHL